jgi:hypothetical protein
VGFACAQPGWQIAGLVRFSRPSRETGNWNDDLKKSDYTQMQSKRRVRKSETFIKDIPVSMT